MNSINQTNIHEIIMIIIILNHLGVSLYIKIFISKNLYQKNIQGLRFNKIGSSSKISKYHKNVIVILYAIDFFEKNTYNINKINYVNENIVGLDPKIDLFTGSAKRADDHYYVKRNNYSETGADCYNYDYPAGNIYKINQNDLKIVMIKKYMDNGEIKTTFKKFNL